MPSLSTGSNGPLSYGSTDLATDPGAGDFTFGADGLDFMDFNGVGEGTFDFDMYLAELEDNGDGGEVGLA